AKTDLPQSTKNILERCHAVSRVKALRVGDGGPGGLRRVIVAVQDVHHRAAQELQAVDVGTALVEVIDVREDARLRMAALQGNQRSLSQPAQRARGPPELDLGHDADLLAYVQESAVTLSSLEETQIGLIRRPRGWGGDALAADLLHQ